KPYVSQDDKAGFKQLTVVAELDVAECFGPNGAKVLGLVRQIETLTPEQAERLGAAWAAARDAASDAAWAAARVAASYATRDAASNAAWAYVVEDLIGQYGYTQEHHDLLVGPWESVMGTDE
ncbi:MAG: hypothetical protein R3330_08780, partial [Saprospiraceae bacterium]|nr:hypothetical protein [Saprospiraceae bacterium]